MPRRYLEILLTPAVLSAQEGAYGVARPVPPGVGDEPLGPDEIAFVAERDSFYLASVSESGGPYVQHRGGPKGFFRVVDARTLEFDDRRGNRQLVSTGNVAADDRVSLFLMDYRGRRRLKILGRATVAAGREPGVERVFTIRVVAWDWNCPQHITPRFTEAEVLEYVRSREE